MYPHCSTKETTMKLKEYCEAKGISSYKLAKLCGVTQPCANRWINEKTTPSLYRIAIITKVSKNKVNALDFVPELDVEDVEALTQ